MDRIKFDIDVSKTVDQLRAVDRKAKKKALRKGVTAATKVIHKQARLNAPRANGFLRMSLRTLVRAAKDGTVVGRIGQEKNKQFKRKRYKGSNLNRKGNAARIWWLESGTKRHAILPSGRALAWQSGRRKGSKGRSVFARKVNHPGIRGQAILEKSGRQASGSAASAFNTAVAADLAKVPPPGSSTGEST